MIKIFGKGKSAKLLAQELGAKRGVRYPYDKETFIVNWGRIADFSGYYNVLNRNLVGNKHEEIKLLDTLSVPYWDNIQGFTESNLDFPVLLRKKNHTQGKDIIFIENLQEFKNALTICNESNICICHKSNCNIRTKIDYDFIVKYIYKKKEYRIHIFKDRCLGIARKLHQDPNYDVTKDIVWSYDNGYRHCFIDQECPQLYELGRRAVDALELDFGAVDIILGMDGKYYILEVNTAPGLIPERVKLYANEIRKWVKSCQS